MSDNIVNESFTKSNYHKAADYASSAIFAAIFVNILLRGAAKAFPEATPFLGVILGLLFLSAIPAGIYALFGIKKFGNKGLLFKGLFGIFIPILATSLVGPTLNNVRNASLRIYADRLVSETSQELPRMIDSVTRFDRITIESDLVIVAEFSIISVSAFDIDYQQWNTEMVPKIRGKAKNGVFDSFEKQGVELLFRYKDMHGRQFSEITIFDKEKS